MTKNFKTNKRIWLLVVIFFFAVISWLLLVQRLIEIERLASQSRVQEANEVALKFAKKEFLERWNDIHAQAKTIIDTHPKAHQSTPQLLQLKSFSSVTFHNYKIEEPYPHQEIVKEIRKDLRNKSITPTTFLEKYTQTNAVKEGRDQIASIALALYKQFPDSIELKQFIIDRAIDYSGSYLQPSHRLFLLNSVEANTQEYGQLLKHLSIATQEDKSKNETYTLETPNYSVSFFWTQEDLSNIATSLENVTFSSTVSKNSLNIEQLSTYPNIVITEKTSPITIPFYLTPKFAAILSGGLLFGLSIYAVSSSRKESQLATMKTELASAMAHELRTPLAGQQLLLETLLKENHLDPNQKTDYLKRAFSENKRLSQLAESFLTFSRLEKQSSFELKEELIQPEKFIDQINHIIQTQWPDDSEHFQTSLDDACPPFTADEALLSTAIFNLIENAWKYSIEDKIIQFSLKQENDQIHFCVRDNGIGIPLKDQERIFKNYYRVDQRLARKRDGLGLGLSIVKQIAEAHNGDVSVISEQNKGSLFTISIPLS